MTLLYIAIVATLVSLLSGAVFSMIFGKKLARDTATCPKCGSMNSVSADPLNSCLVIECECENCDYRSSLPVRPSALSLFGLAQLLLTIIIGILGFVFGCKLGYGPVGKVMTIFTCMIIGGIFVRFFVRFITFFLLSHGVSPIWKKEIVAYLASPFPRQGKQGESE